MNAKTTISNVANKVANSKVYKAIEKGAVTLGAGAVAVGTMAVNSFASEAGSVALSSIKSEDIVNTAMPFINIGLPILCVVGGLRLGIKFLRGSMH